MSVQTTALEAPWQSNIEGLWRARELPRHRVADVGISTGFPALDDVLADQGWPPAGLVELLSEDYGIGELRLLSPALATLSSTDDRCIAWVNPPHLPYAPALHAVGIDPARVLLVNANDHAEALWALEQACKSGACSAVLGWLEPSAGEREGLAPRMKEPKVRFTEIRRLQFAAKQGRTWANLFRPVRATREASAAELRLRLGPLSEDRLNVDIVKRRGGWPLQGIELPLSVGLTQRRHRLGEALERWRRKRFAAASR